MWKAKEDEAKVRYLKELQEFNKMKKMSAPEEETKMQGLMKKVAEGKLEETEEAASVSELSQDEDGNRKDEALIA